MGKIKQYIDRVRDLGGRHSNAIVNSSLITVLSGVIATIGLSRFSNGESPSKFLEGTHPNVTAIRYASKYHGGFKEAGNDRDYDGDGHDDLYVEAEDGTVFHTRSSDPLKLREFGVPWYKLEGEGE